MNNFHVDWLAKWAKYTPNKFFLREYNTGREWSYSLFNNAANHLAEYLKTEIGLVKGERLAVYSTNNSEFVLLFSACIKIGVILVPFNFRLMPQELDSLIEDAKPTMIVYETEYEDSFRKLKSISKECIVKTINDISEFFKFKDEKIRLQTSATFSENDQVMILYTSGTTGRSKGAIINHKMLFWNAVNTALRLDLNSQDHTQSFAPFFHTGGWNVLFTPFLHCGASHTILTKFDPDLILELMEKEKSTILFGVPTMLQMMSDSPKFETTDLSSVRYAIVGGAPMPIPLIEKWHAKEVFIRQGYGLTEVGPNVFSIHHEDAMRKKGSIGFPNFYFETKLINDFGNVCKTNEVGELWLKAPVVTPGYWKNEAATEEAITDGWFHTGDMMKFDEDGFYFVVDRKKNMFISGGENVYPAEVEKLLYTNNKVKEVAVIGVPDEKWGEVGKAFIVPESDQSLDVSELAQFCQNQIAKYKIPKYFEIINELPKNDAGKIDRKALNNIHNKLSNQITELQ